jgi:hypothetical protein
MAKNKRDNQFEMVLDSLKAEIAAEMGIELGALQTSRNNGSVGGEMTKRLITIAEELLQNQNKLQ